MTSRLVYDQRPASPPEVSFLVPVYNERAFVSATLDRLADVPFSHETIVVDDGSNDGTRDILQGKPRPGVALFFHEMNQGKGGAIQTALAQARGRFTAIQDADLEYDPFDYVGLLTMAKDRNLEAVFGSRFLRDNPTAYQRYLMGNKVMTSWINFLCGSRFTDCYTCYKLLTTDAFRGLNIESSGFEMEAEVSVKVALRGLRYAEAPIRYQPRRLEEGKKIGWRDAWKGMVRARRWAAREKATPAARA
jgi:dolichol-phosphate mannosyltransferase